MSKFFCCYMDNIFFVLCEENERVSFAAIFYGGDSRARLERLAARNRRASPARTPGEHRPASVLCARISCARSSASRTQGPPTHRGRAVRGRGGDSDAAAAPCAQEHFVFDFGD